MAEQLICVKRFGALRGADSQSIETLSGIEEGVIVRVKLTRPSKRSLQMHNLFFSMIETIGDAIDMNKGQVLCWMKIAVGHCDAIVSPRTGEVVWMPRSISFNAMDQKTFQDFFDMAIVAALDRLLPVGTVRAELEEEIFGRAGMGDAPPAWGAA